MSLNTALAARTAIIVACLKPLAVAAQEQRALFIGNSFSYVQGGVWAQYESIAEYCVPGLQVSVTSNAVGARTLSMSIAGPPAEMVKSGGYDLLVLQDQSDLMISGTSAVHDFFAPEAARHKATVGFYETWAKPVTGSNFTTGTLWRKAVYEKYAEISRDAGVPRVLIARVGEAFSKVLELYSGDTDEPAFNALYDIDREHPSLLGINLAAWVMVLAFNSDRFQAGGCDSSRVPLVPGQTEQQKRTFASIACWLSDLCPDPARAPLPSQQLCKTARALQGRWVQNKTSAEAHCATAAGQKLPADCTHLVEWEVSDTSVTRRAEGKVESHNLRIRDYGWFCSVKLTPELVYVSKTTANKILFNDCQVWTRSGSEAVAKPNECMCIQTSSWKDGEGNTCDVYESGQPKHDPTSCNWGSGGIVSQSKRLRAWQACPGCQRCQGMLHKSAPPQLLV